MVAKAETLQINIESGNGRKAAEEKIRDIWRQFYAHSIDEPTRIRQLDEAIDSFPSEIQDWLFGVVDGRDSHRPITRIMKLAEEELLKAIPLSRSRGERTFVRREKSNIRRGH